MAKQTFTTGQVLTAAQMTSLQQTAMGGGSATAKTANYVLVAADAGTTVAMNAAGATTITVNTGLFAAGDTVFIQNLGAGVCTITAGTATVNTASSLALAQYESGNLYFTATGTSIFYKSDGAAAGGGGKVLQVVNVNYSTELNSTSTSFIDTGLSASITPTSATSKVLIMVNQNGCIKASGDGFGLILLKGSTKLSDFAAFGYNNAAGYSTVACHSLEYLDSPATTSSITYKTQSKVASGAGNYYLQYVAYSQVSVSSMTLLEIGA